MDETGTLQRNAERGGHIRQLRPRAIRRDDSLVEWGCITVHHRRLATESTRTVLKIGRLIVRDLGDLGLKVQLLTRHADEPEAELLPPAETLLFVNWIDTVGGRLAEAHLAAEAIPTKGRL